MIKGVGIDVVEIERVREAVAKYGNRFLDRIYTPREIQYCTHQRKYLYPELAVRFAAKEAYAKALGSGMRGIFWPEIEVLNNKLGRPFLRVRGRKIKGAHLSLSHSRESAVAMVVIER